MSARRVHGVQRALTTLARPALAGLLMLGLGVGAMPAGVTASAAPSAPHARAATAPDPSATEPIIELVAAPTAPSVAPGEPVALRVTVRNTGGSASAAGALAVGLEGGTRATRTALEAWFSGADQDSALPAVAEATLPALDVGAATVIEVVVPAEAAGLTGEWGPRLVVATAMMGDAPAAASRTAVTFAPPESAPAAATVRVVTPLSTPESESALLTAEELAELTGPDGQLTRTLDAVEGTAAALGVDPRIVASIRLLGTAAPESATALLERLAGLSNPTFALAWADADPTATVLARGIPLPAVEGAGGPLDASLLDTGVGVPPEVVGPEPSIAPSDEASPVPSASASPSPSAAPDDAPVDEETITLGQLAAWPHDLEDWAWPRTGGLSPAGVEVLVAGGTRTIIAGDAQLDGAAGSAARAGEATLAVADDSASLAAIGVTTATVQQQAQASTAELAALLAARAVEQPGAAALLALDRTAAQSAARLDGLLTAVDALPWADITPLGQPAATAPATTVGEGALPEGLVGAIGTALDAEAVDREFARIAVDPAAITDIRRLELLAALSLGWGEDATAAVQRFTAASSELRSSVQIVESPRILVLADGLFTVPLTVQNGLGTPIVVYVHVESATGQLRVLESRVETGIDGGAQAVAAVPVESLTNGDVDITITVRDAEGRTISGPITVPLSLQAGWETAGIVALTAAILGLLVAGLIRDIRRRRTRRAASVEPAPGDHDAAP
ncbi:DUF6049 family protein [Microcella daejeonensis]|uniref:DUF6049 family protein n=1 Tax=Microcella daejeonensis TaxID=2994971 RepID=UPI00226E2E71|nr:DUF6049 family protein [Microcella daejeonensis]WAB84483.1 DUF6049 family protein [Microcella daejeonensis]